MQRPHAPETVLASKPGSFFRAVLALVMLLTASSAGAQTRVLLVGDSWAEFMWQFRTLRGVFAANGRPDILERGTQTALGGTTAAEWRQPASLQLIRSELDSNPTIDTVQITIGGNDFLAGRSGGGYFAGMSQAQLNALVKQVRADLAVVVDTVLAHRPDLEVVISLYDYVNFVDTQLFPGCNGTWQDLDSPTPRQVNEAFVVLQNAAAGLAASRPRASFVDHRGLMQFTFGFPDDGIPPGALRPPGDINRPSPTQAMFLQNDCIHLNSAGYTAVAQNLWNQYYDARFNGVTEPIPSAALAQDVIVANENDGQVSATVSLSSAPIGPAMIDYRTVSDSAVAGEDFQALSGTLFWDAGSPMEQTLGIVLLDDEVMEGNETFTLELSNPQGQVQLSGDRASTRISLLDDDGASTCTPSEQVLCLQDGRFKVEVDWLTVEGNSGFGTQQPLSNSSGLFWFFSPDNFEMILKVLNGCSITGLEAYWVFIAATTNVEYRVRVTDTQTGLIQEYTNPQSQAALPVQDVTTFRSSCP
ncbi:MAG: Calx-beta domain-containing protein [Acidobacteriota bacterium]